MIGHFSIVVVTLSSDCAVNFGNKRGGTLTSRSFDDDKNVDKSNKLILIIIIIIIIIHSLIYSGAPLRVEGPQKGAPYSSKKNIFIRVDFDGHEVT